MPIPVYSTRFGSWHHETGLVNVVNDTGLVWVVRYMSAYNGNFAEVTTLAVGDYATGATVWAPNVNMAPGGWWYDWHGRWVIPPFDGSTTQGFGWETSGFPIDLYIGGYELTPP